MEYKKYSRKEMIKILEKEAILFADTNLGENYIIRQKDIADFIILETERTGHIVQIKFYMPDISEPVATTCGWFLNKINPLLREEIIDRLVSLYKPQIKKLVKSKYSIMRYLLISHQLKWELKIILQNILISFIKNMLWLKKNIIKKERNFIIMEKSIIQVKYEDDFYPRTFHGKEYSYYTNKVLNVGDLVEAPTKYSVKIAKVTRTDVPEDEIKDIKPYMKTITRKIDKNRYINFYEVLEDVA